MFVSGIKKIFLPQMTKFRADFARHFQMVVDDQIDIRGARNRHNCFGHATNFFDWGILCAQLDQIRPAVTKLLRDQLRRAAMQIRGIHERVEEAVGKRFHTIEGDTRIFTP